MADEEENTTQICTKKRKQKRNSKLQSCGLQVAFFISHHPLIQPLHPPIPDEHHPTKDINEFLRL